MSIFLLSMFSHILVSLVLCGHENTQWLAFRARKHFKEYTTGKCIVEEKLESDVRKKYMKEKQYDKYGFCANLLLKWSLICFLHF